MRSGTAKPPQVIGKNITTSGERIGNITNSWEKPVFFLPNWKIHSSTAGFGVPPSVERNKTTPQKTRWRVLKRRPYRKGRKWKRPACFEIVIYFINNFRVLPIFQNGLCLTSTGIFMLRHYISQSCNIAPLLLSDVYKPNPEERGA